METKGFPTQASLFGQLDFKKDLRTCLALAILKLISRHIDTFTDDGSELRNFKARAGTLGFAICYPGVCHSHSIKLKLRHTARIHPGRGFKLKQAGIMKQAHEKNSNPIPVDHGLAYNQGLKCN